MRNHGKMYFIGVLFVVSSLFFFSSCNENQVTEPQSFDPGKSNFLGGEAEGDCNENTSAMTKRSGDNKTHEPPLENTYGAFGFSFQWDMSNINQEDKELEFYMTSNSEDGIKVDYFTADQFISCNFSVYHLNSSNLTFTWKLDGNTLSSGVGNTSVSFQANEPLLQDTYYLELEVDGSSPCEDYRFWVEIQVLNQSAS